MELRTTLCAEAVAIGQALALLPFGRGMQCLRLVEPLSSGRSRTYTANQYREPMPRIKAVWNEPARARGSDLPHGR